MLIRCRDAPVKQRTEPTDLAKKRTDWWGRLTKTRILAGFWPKSAVRFALRAYDDLRSADARSANAITTQKPELPDRSRCRRQPQPLSLSASLRALIPPSGARGPASPIGALEHVPFSASHVAGGSQAWRLETHLPVPSHACDARAPFSHDAFEHSTAGPGYAHAFSFTPSH
jgi:hypothetical protein